MPPPGQTDVRPTDKENTSAIVDNEQNKLKQTGDQQKSTHVQNSTRSSLVNGVLQIRNGQSSRSVSVKGFDHILGESPEKTCACECDIGESENGWNSNCSVCVKGFTKLLDLHSHMTMVHSRETVHSKCFFCVRGILKVKDLEVHCTTHKEGKSFCSCNQ